jgi:hypothetical protein
MLDFFLTHWLKNLAHKESKINSREGGILLSPLLQDLIKELKNNPDLLHTINKHSLDADLGSTQEIPSHSITAYRE